MQTKRDELLHELGELCFLYAARFTANPNGEYRFLGLKINETDYPKVYKRMKIICEKLYTEN